MRRTLLAGSAVAAIAAACYSGPHIDDSSVAQPVGSTAGTEPESSASGLPCALAQMLVARCGTCHDRGDNTVLTYEALTGPDPKDPGRVLADVALERMRDRSRPMPPSGPLPAAEVALLADWERAGMPRGTCAASPGGDAATATAAPAALTGLPCDVSSLLAGRCVTCHSGPSATPLTYESLTSPSPHDPQKLLAAVAVERMQDAARPMPPSGLLGAGDVGVIESWLRSGTPRGSCELPVVDAGGAVDAGPVAATGLPCDLAALFESGCATCHAQIGRTPFTYATLTSPSPSTPARTLAEVALARMQDPAKPMPPSGLPPSASVALLQRWIASGTPRGACEAPDAGPGPFDGPLVCTSGTFWTMGNEGSSRMHPGRACGSCHGAGQIAGTVYPTGHEPDDCNGTSSGVTVVITGADGAQVSLATNTAGNFRRKLRGVALPYTAKVIAGGRTRAMITPQTSGDCNACHSAAGTAGPTGAPGRIVAP